MPAVPGIPRHLSRDHVLRALADLDAGFDAPFGDPTKFVLVYEGRQYAPKAVIGLACRHLTGHILPLKQFSGGEARGHANYVLRRLGFEVITKQAGGDAESRDWTETEVAATVADYFDMLRKELHGEKYNKSEHRSNLRLLLTGRSNQAVEYKRRNISAVLVRMGLPYIPGYLPAGNFQALLARGVGAFLEAHPSYLDELAEAPALDPPAPAAPPSVGAAVFEDRPEHIALPEPGKPWVTRRVRRVDFVARDAANRRLGRMGEEFVVEFERARLRKAGLNKLARQVDRVSETIGDGLGFDVLSFDEDGSERLVEVKTTGLGRHFPFYVTSTEVRCSEDVPDQFQLYRVFDFARTPRVYRLKGSLRETCRLEPTQYRAGVGESSDD